MSKNKHGRIDRNPVISLLNELFENHIFEGAATISYFLLFSIFPFLLFFSAALSSLSLNLTLDSSFYSSFFPYKVLNLLKPFFQDISEHNSWLIWGLILTVLSLGKAVSAIKHRIRAAFHSSPDINLVLEWITSFIFALLILIAFYGFLIILFAGEKLLVLLNAFSDFNIAESPFLKSFKVIICVAFVFFVICGIHLVLPAANLRLKEALPGSVISLTGIFLFSKLFTFYVDRLNGLSAIYGSLGGVIALLSWLYITGFLLLFGAHVNAYLFRHNREVHL